MTSVLNEPQTSEQLVGLQCNLHILCTKHTQSMYHSIALFRERSLNFCSHAFMEFLRCVCEKERPIDDVTHSFHYIKHQTIHNTTHRSTNIFFGVNNNLFWDGLKLMFCFLSEIGDNMTVSNLYCKNAASYFSDGPELSKSIAYEQSFRIRYIYL